MPNKPLRPCRHPGCSALTSSGYCPAHQPRRRDTRRASAEYHSLYASALWQGDLRPAQLLAEPWCRECAKRGLRTPATVVDHIRPHRGDPALFADRGNLQSLCERCHNRKTARERAQTRGKQCG